MDGERSEAECVVEGALAGLATLVLGFIGGQALVIVVGLTCSEVVIRRLDASPPLLTFEEWLALAPGLMVAGTLLPALLLGRLHTRSWRRAPRAWGVVLLAAVAAAGTHASPAGASEAGVWLAGLAGGALGGVGFLRPPRAGWA